MTFVAGFYSFNIELAHTDHGLYENLRFKLPRHPDESDQYFLARVIAYSTDFQDGLKFSRGLFESKEPTLWKHSEIEELLIWTEVGLPEISKLERALRHHPTAKFSFYFYAPEQIDQFCYHLRGSKTNWVKDISFYLIDPIFLEKLAPHLKTSNKWQITVTEGDLYLTVNNEALETQVAPVDIWSRFQMSLTGS